MRITKKQLVEVLEDMNEVMELDPPIDVSVSLDELLEQFDEAVGQVEPDDEFKKETWNVINASQDGSLDIDDSEKKSSSIGNDRGAKKRESKGKVSSGRKKGKRTRAGVMADILLASKSKPLTKEDMINKMISMYKGSKAEAKFQVSVYVRLLMRLNLLETDEMNRMKYIG